MVKRSIEITALEFLGFIVLLILALIELNIFISTQKAEPMTYVFANALFFIILFISWLGYKVFYNPNEKEVKNGQKRANN